MYCIYIALLLALVSCEINHNCPLTFSDGNTSLQNGLNLFKSQLNKKKAPLGIRIFGGVYVMDIEEYPFMAIMVHKSGNSKKSVVNCGATIISQNYLLTAAHCFGTRGNRRHAEDFTIYVGGLSVERVSDTAKIERYFVHPKFIKKDNTSKCFGDNDIAVVKLSKTLRFSNKIGKVRLPPASVVNSTSGLTSRLKQQRCELLGWGRTAMHMRLPQPNLLKVAHVKVVSYQQCASYHTCKFTQICTVDPRNKNGSCRGDSGGPLLCDGVQVGISSFSKKICVPKQGSIKTRVEYYVDWINQIITNDEERG